MDLLVRQCAPEEDTLSFEGIDICPTTWSFATSLLSKESVPCVIVCNRSNRGSR